VIGHQVLLRPYGLDDVDAVHAYYSRADVSRYLRTSPMSRDAVVELVAARAQRVRPERSGEALALVVEHAGHLVGDVVLILGGSHVDCGEIGWVLNPAFGGRGLATEAAELLLRLAFDHYGLATVTARLDGRNHASARLCVRLGMDLVGARQEWTSGESVAVQTYAMPAERWRQRAAEPGPARGKAR
jgi:RimJ/RimL family protein N-acetyltransferase